MLPTPRVSINVWSTSQRTRQRGSIGGSNRLKMLKMLKRQMYGRADPDLLRRRVLLAARLE
ncbi:hypothetical protein ACFQZ2_00105 [Streptomonospora algeriensis]|uniref:Transposase n=1 Tax=Streptomonospora algeriensis TaxID=995084 RepID=A0ABW3B9V8_9ACTN